LCFSFSSAAYPRTGGDGGFLKNRPGRLDETGPLPKAFDHILKDGKDPEKESEDGGLVEGGVDQRLLFKTAAEAQQSSDE